jgi:hypothetical protein
MANNCMNWVSIYGEDATLNIIASKLETYHDHKGSFLNWGDMVVNKKTEEERDPYDYGTSYWELDVEREYGVINVSGDSAWSPPIELIKQICTEYKVHATIEYEEAGSDFGGMTEFNRLGEAISEIKMRYDEWRYRDGTEHILNIVSDVEDCIGSYDSQEDLLKRYYFLSKEDAEYLIEEYNKLKKL